MPLDGKVQKTGTERLTYFIKRKNVTISGMYFLLLQFLLLFLPWAGHKYLFTWQKTNPHTNPKRF